ncbi:MAG: hypothetical protein CMO40_04235 [Verrucomicrobiaceae bacterium]|nr:hypothetical protein [Verrucomicrobiaceae bacterium]
MITCLGEAISLRFLAAVRCGPGNAGGDTCEFSPECLVGKKAGKVSVDFSGALRGEGDRHASSATLRCRSEDAASEQEE